MKTLAKRKGGREMGSYFIIKGDKESGKYIVLESGNPVPIIEITDMHYGGLKEARQWIGNYLKSEGYGLNSVFEHQCVKPGRKNNPVHNWTVEEYLIGVSSK